MPDCRHTHTRAQFQQVRDLLALETGVSEIARATGLSRQTIYRIEQDPAAQEAALAIWAAPNVKRAV